VSCHRAGFNQGCFEFVHTAVQISLGLPLIVFNYQNVDVDSDLNRNRSVAIAMIVDFAMGDIQQDCCYLRCLIDIGVGLGWRAN